MQWCWELENWPNFKYDKDLFWHYEASFFKNTGLFIGFFETISEEEQMNLKLRIMLDEAIASSKIEGEILERESVQSSICKEFGLKNDTLIKTPQERGIGKLMRYNFLNFNKPLSKNVLQQMNGLLWDVLEKPFRNTAINVVSGRIDEPNIHFQAPPADRIAHEIKQFCAWFNHSSRPNFLPATLRASIAHLYFVIIHPFEDGNGRIARSLAEKSLSQSLNQSCLIALSATIEKHRKHYYEMLAETNHSLDISQWAVFFSDLILEAQQDSIRKVKLITNESKLFQKLGTQLNERQKKCIRRLFQAELDGGFVGGLSASNYVSITQTSTATATRDIAQLVQLGILFKTGENKHARYFLQQNLE